MSKKGSFLTFGLNYSLHLLPLICRLCPIGVEDVDLEEIKQLAVKGIYYKAKGRRYNLVDKSKCGWLAVGNNFQMNISPVCP